MSRSFPARAISIAGFLFLYGTSVTFADFTIEAPTGTFGKDTTVTLARHEVERRASARVINTQSNPDGSFIISSDKEAGIYELEISGEEKLTLAISEGEKITLETTNGKIQIDGSEGTEILKRYDKLRKESLSRLVYPARKDIKMAKLRFADDEEIAKLTQAEVDAYNEHLRELNDFVIENAGTTMALYGTSLRWSFDYRGDELSDLVAKFVEKHGDINASRSLKQRTSTAQSVALGATAPNLSGPNLEGAIESLENYRGRYVLVDFWASWCPPCRVENKHYQKLVSKVPESKFTIFAVNLDTRKQLWSQAVKRDKASWVHMSDLKGWRSELAATYGVNALPGSFLLDPEGRVIAKNLRGPALDAKLKELGLL